jgi:hypothetical protein
LKLCIIRINLREGRLKVMPTLKHLLEELKKLAADPDGIRVPGTLYDDLVEQAEDTTEDEEEWLVQITEATARYSDKHRKSKNDKTTNSYRQGYTHKVSHKTGLQSS